MKKLEDFLTARRIIGTLPEDIKNVIKEIDNKDVVIDVGANIGDIN